MFSVKKLRWFLLAVFTLTLVACGGGGSSSSSDSSASTDPVANAGSNQNVLSGSTVTLDGSESNDPDGELLTYEWRFVSKPDGSTATLSDREAVKTTFVADVDGEYVLELTVDDGTVSVLSDPISITATTGNSAPVANAGNSQNVTTNSVVTLDGSASTDADGDPLTYAWSFDSVPNGSTAVSTLSDSAASSPTFTADMDGDYVLRLVVSDGAADSAPDTVIVTAATGNAAPVANAGTNQNVTTGTVISLDGSGSSDIDGDTLTYAWSFVSVPNSSSAASDLSDNTAVKPTFTVDVAGNYVLRLVVNDGTADSEPATVTITAATTNSAPVANAGTNQNVATGTVVVLDGSGSADADGDLLTYTWSFASVPNGSTAASSLSDSTATNPTFTADVAGNYVLRLVVNDGTADSDPETVTITAATSNSAPVANAGSSQNVDTNSVVNLDGSASTDADGDLLTYAWSFVSVPNGSAAASSLSDSTATNPTFTADVAGNYVLRLVVNDGTADSEPATVTISAVYFEPRVELYRKSSSFFSDTYNLISWPYNASTSASASVTGIPQPTSYTIDSFKMIAVDGQFTIVNVEAVNKTSGIQPYFVGIDENDILSNGEEVSFELVSPLTGGATVELEFTFEILETGNTFSSRVVLTTN